MILQIIILLKKAHIHLILIIHKEKSQKDKLVKEQLLNFLLENKHQLMMDYQQL